MRFAGIIVARQSGLYSSASRSMLQTLLETGVRTSELVQPHVEDVSLAERVITVRSGKGGKRTEVPIRCALTQLGIFSSCPSLSARRGREPHHGCLANDDHKRAVTASASTASSLSSATTGGVVQSGFCAVALTGEPAPPVAEREPR
ncbi:MAG: tyrosine-type recombinase/integrase [Acetobacteraceae bacterium]